MPARKCRAGISFLLLRSRNYPRGPRGSRRLYRLLAESLAGRQAADLYRGRPCAARCGLSLQPNRAGAGRRIGGPAQESPTMPPAPFQRHRRPAPSLARLGGAAPDAGPTSCRTANLVRFATRRTQRSRALPRAEPAHVDGAAGVAPSGPEFVTAATLAVALSGKKERKKEKRRTRNTSSPLFNLPERGQKLTGVRRPDTSSHPPRRGRRIKGRGALCAAAPESARKPRAARPSARAWGHTPRSPPLRRLSTAAPRISVLSLARRELRLS